MVGNYNSVKHIKDIDPEKLYFVDKIGYVIDKMGGYGEYLQDELICRLIDTVKTFQDEIPQLLENIQIKHTDLINSLKKQYIDDNPVSLADKSNNIHKISSINQEPAKKMNDIKISPKNNIKDNANHSHSSILKPLLAAELEEERLHQIKLMQEQTTEQPAKNVSDYKYKSKKKRSEKLLTDWEKRLYKYNVDEASASYNFNQN